jgi:hypothetical protein
MLRLTPVVHQEVALPCAHCQVEAIAGPAQRSHLLRCLRTPTAQEVGSCLRAECSCCPHALPLLCWSSKHPDACMQEQSAVPVHC